MVQIIRLGYINSQVGKYYFIISNVLKMTNVRIRTKTKSYIFFRTIHILQIVHSYIIYPSIPVPIHVKL